MKNLAIILFGSFFAVSCSTINPNVSYSDHTLPKRLPASESKISEPQEVYMALHQIFESIKSGKAHQSCNDQDLHALNSMGIYVTSLNTVQFRDEVIVYPTFNKSGDKSKAELGYGMCFRGSLADWSNLVKK